MPPRRKKSGGLTDDDVARLRKQLAEGRRPRVQLSGPQFEAGSSGSVVRIGDPDADGTDFLTVRVKVNGISDELAFAPAELSLGRAATGQAEGGRTPSAGRRTSTATQRRPAAEPKPAAAQPTAADQPKPAAQPTAATQPKPAAQPKPMTPAEPSVAASAGSGSSVKARESSAPAELTDDAAGSAKPTGRRRKAPAAPATVSVTISSAGASWSLSAHRGAKVITKGVPVAPGVVTAIAELLDQAALAEAVADINETARLQAEERAEQLRAELSSLEAVLATHHAPRRPGGTSTSNQHA